MSEINQVARVYLLDLPYHLDKLYDYYIPKSLREDIHAGIFAEVPFSNSNRHHLALVYEVVENSEYTLDSLKPIIKTADNAFELGDEQMKLAVFIAERTLCSFGDALRSMLPPSAFAKIKTVYRIRERDLPIEAYSEPAQRLLEEFDKKKQLTRTQISALVGDYTDKVIKELVGLRVIAPDYLLDENQNVRYICYYSLSDGAFGYLIGDKKLRSSKQLSVLGFIQKQGRVSDKELKEKLNCTKKQISALVEKGLVKEERYDVFRDPYADAASEDTRIVLNEEQKAAKETLVSLAKEDRPAAALLYGVTGSGKTSVIKEAADSVLADGRQVIILVPEIALTPQTVKLFKSFYGDNIAVYHSSLSAGERLDAYRRVRSGEINVCIGTRSAIFAPFENLGLIVIDEEQEHTYKSDMTPRFSTVDVASFRCGYHNALMLLSSATPSLGSMHKA
ncbi:MAG: DEAD/DEAH box helicase family protein, partial [Clostridia bacterium]|nr:DEAD/DEAH box helicase family protein [Clostridia bacterium]